MRLYAPLPTKGGRSQAVRADYSLHKECVGRESTYTNALYTSNDKVNFSLMSLEKVVLRAVVSHRARGLSVASDAVEAADLRLRAGERNTLEIWPETQENRK